MRILLDNCVPVRFASHLEGHDVETALSKGWESKPDGTLLDLISGNFDVFITVDKNLVKQNRIQGREFAVIVLRAKTNQLKHLLQLLPQLEVALKRAAAGDIIEVAVQ